MGNDHPKPVRRVSSLPSLVRFNRLLFYRPFHDSGCNFYLAWAYCSL